VTGVTVDESGRPKFSTDLADVPEQPSWQTEDLLPVAYPSPWLTQGDERWRAITEVDATDAYNVALALVRALIETMRAKPDLYRPLRSFLNHLWLRVVIATGGGVNRSGNPFTPMDRVFLTTIGVFGIAPLVQNESDPMGPPLAVTINQDSRVAADLRLHRQLIRDRIRQYLAAIDVPLHWWSEAAALGLMLHPQGIAWVRPPFHLGPKTGSTAIERGIDMAFGVPEKTYRIASKFHRAFLAAHGVAFVGKSRGARPGHSRKKTKARRKFENYVLSRAEARQSPQAIVEDAEAQRLYGLARKDSTVELREQHVRHVIRTARKSEKSR
jgi:hypothetical protein